MRSIEKKAKTVDEAIWSGLQELQLSRENVTVEIIEPGSKGFLGLGAKPAHVRLTEIHGEEKISFADLLKNDLDMSMKSDPTPPKVKKPEPIATKPPTKEIPKGSTAQPPLAVLPQEKIAPKKEIKQPVREESEPPRRRREDFTPTRSRSKPNRREGKRISQVENVDWPIPTEGAPKIAYDYATQIIQAMKLKCRVNVRVDEDGILVDLSGDEDDLGILIGKRGATLDAFQYLLTVVANRDLNDRIRLTLNVGDYRKRREETLLRLAKRLADEVVQTGKSVALEPMSARERRLIHMALQENNLVYTESSGEESYRHVVIYKKA